MKTLRNRLLSDRARRGRWPIGLACLLALALLTLSRGGTQSTIALAVGNGRIVFASDRTGNWDIFAMDSDGSHVVNLTNSPMDEERAGNSPDAQKIAFARTLNDNTDIYTMNADGSGITRLTTGPAIDHAPQWSPDGQRIAFRSDRDGNGNVYVMDVDGSDQTRLTNNPADDSGPDWSPDGQKIVFSSNRTGNSDVFVMDADGSDQVQLTTDPADDFGASWSPDGTRIAFRSGRDGTSEVYVMTINGQAQTNLTNHPAFDRGPAWSPDGSRLVFYSNRDGNYEIYTMDANGAHVVRLTNSPGRDFQPDWGVGQGDPPPACYTLTRSHTGQGGDPAASPTKSTGCGAGQYIAGESITLTATPSAGWGVTGWSGTNNDSSTAPTNTVTMPTANHAVSVAYDPTPPTCYNLTRSHTGQGSAPVASPNKSTGCGAGQYMAGEDITLMATPAFGWYVAGWDGTNDDASVTTTNTVTMPAADHAASVIYDQTPPTCYTLTRSHSGQGSDPVATPDRSAGCDLGRYVAGEAISLTATPAPGWRVVGWSGTNDDAATTMTNTVTMPTTDHEVSATYEAVPYRLYAPVAFAGAGAAAR